MKRILYLFVFSVSMILTSSGLRAQSGPLASDSRRDAESVYLTFGLGVPMNAYPSDTRAMIDELQGSEGVSRIPVDGELGVLWPVVDEQTVIGPSLRASGDNLSRGDQSIGFTLISFVANARRYLTGPVGDGLFGRVDAGVAFAGLSHRYGGITTGTTTSEFGVHAGAGAGYALPLSGGTSLELNATGSYRWLPGYESGEEVDGEIFEKGSYLSGSIGIALLW